MCHLYPFMNSELVFCKTERLRLFMATLLSVYFIYSYMHMNEKENRGDIGCVPRGLCLESVSIAANSKPQLRVERSMETSLNWTVPQIPHSYEHLPFGTPMTYDRYICNCIFPAKFVCYSYSLYDSFLNMLTCIVFFIQNLRLFFQLIKTKKPLVWLAKIPLSPILDSL